MSTAHCHKTRRKPHFSDSRGEFRRDVVQGLKSEKKRIPCKYFYDKRGSELFDSICELDEYYLTRTELKIMQDHASAMAKYIGKNALLVELGSGSSIKTRILLDEVIDPVAYCPVDISQDHLLQTAAALSSDYPDLAVLPVVADFVQRFELPQSLNADAKVAAYFPGSTIGNFEPEAAKRMLRRIVELCQPKGGLLIGIDLQKDTDVIEAAYNDEAGVTDQFNLNLLERINRELRADFVVDQFRHRAFYDHDENRVDISLVSEVEQTVTIGEESITLEEGESIHTEYSHKYTIDSFAVLAESVGLSLAASWTDEQEYFAVLYLETT